jgi:hypothetical protein
MNALAIAMALSVVSQVPPPTTSGQVAQPFRLEERAILDREASKIRVLAEKLRDAGQAEAAEAVRKALPPKTPADGASRFAPIPEVEPARSEGLKNIPPAGAGAWRADLEAIRKASAKELFDLAGRAASLQPTRQLAIADACLREVIARQPDHAEARRLLGHQSFNGGWATPFAVDQMKDGKTLHPVYGWVPRGWVPHLERGELPGKVSSVPGRETWLPAAEADALHRDWPNAWTIRTEHFWIKTNVPLSEAIAFGRNLETFHDLFEAMFADVIGPSLPLAKRFQDKKMVGERPSDPHEVSYFADRVEYIENLRPVKQEIDQSIGFYQPPTSPRTKRGHAYFFRDVAGDIDVTATLYHEVSHQLLFESGVAPANAYKKNAGNFWVFEGLGTYFETFTVAPEGTVEVGGLVGPRMTEARKNLTSRRTIVPFERFVRYDENGFNERGDIFRHYQQAIALTAFLMQAEGGRYRDDFLAYVKDACQGRLRVTSGQSLEARLGVPYSELEDQFLAYLKSGQAAK